MPRLLEVARLCNYVYDQTLIPRGWERIDRESAAPITINGVDSKYLVQAFRDQKNQEIVIVHYSTQLCFENRKDFPPEVNIALEFC